jgi:hypothetical protein
MNCNDARERIDARGGRDRGPVDPALREHLDHCEDCRHEHERMRELRARIEALPRSIEPSTDLWNGIRSRIDEPKVVRPEFGGGGEWRRWGLVAAMSVAWEEFETAEAEYQRVTDELLQALEQRRDRLTPETIETVETNLRLIDEAITEARAALERDPSNAALATRLTDIYRRRVGFLQQMNRL